jgi:hypothetical protein
VPGPRPTERTPPVVFDADAWAEDIRRASAVGRSVAGHARSEFETNGVPIDQLKACDPEGDDGTQLPNCVQVYLPAPDGPHGMVFEIDRIAVACGCSTQVSACATRPGTCDSRRCTRSHTDGCTRRLRTDASTA